MTDEEKKVVARLVRAAETVSFFHYDPSSRNPHHHRAKREMRDELRAALDRAKKVLGE